jgi:hypothetical protein
MLKRFSFALFPLFLLSATSAACADGSDPSSDESDVKRGRKVAGYDFEGPKITEALAPNAACPEVVTAEADACRAARGSDTYTRGCGLLCSVPIAQKGRVAGFDFAGFRSDEALAPMTACPQIADPVTDACLAVRGQTAYTKSCGVLCSLPVAPEGKVAGFDFSGYRSVEALGPMRACPEVMSPVADACLSKKGRTSYTRDCSVVCSVPVAP